MRAIYEMLIQMPPLSRWNLPPSNKVEFHATNDPTCYGEFEPPNIIRLSRKKVGHLDTAVKTMAHEILHYRLHLMNHSDWDKHTGKFLELGEKIALTMGFDPKEF